MFPPPLETLYEIWLQLAYWLLSRCFICFKSSKFERLWNEIWDLIESVSEEFLTYSFRYGVFIGNFAVENYVIFLIR